MKNAKMSISIPTTCGVCGANSKYLSMSIPGTYDTVEFRICMLDAVLTVEEYLFMCDDCLSLVLRCTRSLAIVHNTRALTQFQTGRGCFLCGTKKLLKRFRLRLGVGSWMVLKRINRQYNIRTQMVYRICSVCDELFTNLGELYDIIRHNPKYKGNAVTTKHKERPKDNKYDDTSIAMLPKLRFSPMSESQPKKETKSTHHLKGGQSKKSKTTNPKLKMPSAAFRINIGVQTDDEDATSLFSTENPKTTRQVLEDLGDIRPKGLQSQYEKSKEDATLPKLNLINIQQHFVPSPENSMTMDENNNANGDSIPINTTDQTVPRLKLSERDSSSKINRGKQIQMTEAQRRRINLIELFRKFQSQSVVDVSPQEVLKSEISEQQTQSYHSTPSLQDAHTSSQCSSNFGSHEVELLRPGETNTDSQGTGRARFDREEYIRRSSHKRQLQRLQYNDLETIVSGEVLVPSCKIQQLLQSESTSDEEIPHLQLNDDSEGEYASSEEEYCQREPDEMEVVENYKDSSKGNIRYQTEATKTFKKETFSQRNSSTELLDSTNSESNYSDHKTATPAKPTDTSISAEFDKNLVKQLRSGMHKKSNPGREPKSVLSKSKPKNPLTSLAGNTKTITKKRHTKPNIDKNVTKMDVKPKAARPPPRRATKVHPLSLSPRMIELARIYNVDVRKLRLKTFVC